MHLFNHVGVMCQVSIISRARLVEPFPTNVVQVQSDEWPVLEPRKPKISLVAFFHVCVELTACLAHIRGTLIMKRCTPHSAALAWGGAHQRLPVLFREIPLADVMILGWH